MEDMFLLEYQSNWSNGHAMNCGACFLELFDDMLEKGVKPDEVVFVAAVIACSYVGLLEQGQNTIGPWHFP